MGGSLDNSMSSMLPLDPSSSLHQGPGGETKGGQLGSELQNPPGEIFLGVRWVQAGQVRFTAGCSGVPGKLCPFRHDRGEKMVVCKHWLRGLCKKGDQCKFLHQYDVTRMPECYFYSKFGNASSSLWPFTPEGGSGGREGLGGMPCMT